MSRRGGYGKPWRQPADGWAVPPKAYLGGLYQHQKGSLNGLTAFQNTTQVVLQPNQVGAPETRFTPSSDGGTCAAHGVNGLPQIPWIGPGSDQFATPPANTFAAGGTVNLSSCRQRGGKWVQAVRQWHGAYGFTSHDGQPCADTVCSDHAYESYQAAPDQTKYLAMSAACTLAQGLTIQQSTVYDYLTGGNYWTHVNTTSFDGAKTCTIETAVGATTGKLQLVTNTTSNTLTQTNGQTDNLYGNSGPTTTDDNGMSVWNGLDPAAVISNWVATACGVSFGAREGVPFSGNASTLATAIAALPGPVDMPGNNFSLTTYLVSATEFKIVLTITPPATTVVTGTGPEPTHGTGSYNYTITTTYAGTATWTLDVVLSSPNTAAAVLADVTGLLSNWNLADDAQYPPRTDGIWQIAPLMSRDEHPGNVTPIQFPPASVTDYRNPINDVNGNAPWTSGTNPPPAGWTYSPHNNDGAGNAYGSPGYAGPWDWYPTYNTVAWFDPNAYGFTFPSGYDSTNSTATALVQFACTGTVLGAPNPAGYQNYFDFYAQVWQCGVVGGLLTWAVEGYGQWLEDVITSTGAQLPLNATQWTNNFDAYNKPPFAYLIQGDLQIYASPPDTTAHRADALWAQKCAVYSDLWPSYDFFRPAGADRFLLDEPTVCCVSGLTSPATGGTFTSQDYTGAPITLTVPTGSVWGGFSVGGFYNISAAGSTVTLGTKVLSLPPTWASRSGDTAVVFGRLRFPTAPAILGRDAVSAVTDNHDGTVTLTLAAAENWLQTGDAVDLYSTTITYDGSGNRVSEAMTSLAANLTATVIDTTHIKVTATYSAVAGTQYLMSHGAPDWSWDDNGRKGDWVYLDWTFDYRTNGEASRLATATDCSGNTPPATGVPAANYGYSGFTQTQHENTTGLPFKPCCPLALCISPNGESFTNGITVGFPGAFNFDGRYGARWQAELEDVMVDLLWQTPHTPCGGGTWNMDDGTCTGNYPYPTLVEARISVPTYGGNAENLTAPTPPTGIGYVSPVTSGSGLAAPGMIGFDSGSGRPTAAWTVWGYRANIEGTCGGCAFNYVDAENLACVSSYVPSVAAAPADAVTGSGSTGDGGIT